MYRLGFVAILVVLHSYSANATCGVSSGPGYRGPNGQCLSWYELAEGVCGCPPTTACRPEQLHRGAESVAKLRCMVPKMRAH
jgi:hypothetical protein